VEEYSRLHIYTPSVHEILVVLGVISFCALAFLLGEKIFYGFSHEEQASAPEETKQEINETQELT